MSALPSEIVRLSTAEKVQLVEDLWDHIATETLAEIVLSETQRVELERRLAEHEANPDQAIPWEIVRAELFNTGR